MFSRKDCGEERKMMERSIFPNLELSKKPMERKNLMGSTLGNLSTAMWRERG